MEPDDGDPISEPGDEERQEAGETDDPAGTAEPDPAAPDQPPQESADRPPEDAETGPTAPDGGLEVPAMPGGQVDDPKARTPLQDVQTSPADDVTAPTGWFEIQTPTTGSLIDPTTTTEQPGGDVPVPPGAEAATAGEGEHVAAPPAHDEVTAADQQPALPPTRPAPIDLPWPSAAETPVASSEAAVWSMGADRSGSSGWGALWRQSAQGWVEDPAGRAVWRPIVTTSATLSEWEVDTYLGLVTGELAVSVDKLEGGLRSARQDAVERMVDDALARGAHAVIGVSVDLVEVSGRVVVSAAGTAVTLKTSE